jgi:hypothetical protein
MTRIRQALVIAALLATRALAYEAFQGPTELLYWNTNQTDNGYTFFGVRGITYLIDMEGRVVHTWPAGTNPHLLDDGSILDASKDDPSGFGGFVQVSWSGSTVWTYTESRTGYFPHHDYVRIFNPKLGTNTTLYIANKNYTYDQCIAAGCNPASGPYTNAQMDVIVEVGPNNAIVWEWAFFDHMVQDYDPAKTNYVGAGKTIADYPGRLNINLPGRPVQRDWLHCNSIDYNQALDQIVINSVGGEFYVVDHGNTFIANNPTGSMALASGPAGDFLYRFGDVARYSQGAAPSILTNWTESTTGNKQIGGTHHVSWIPAGLPGAGNLLMFSNSQNLFEHTQGSYVFEVDPFRNAASSHTASYVNPPAAGFDLWPAPGPNTDKAPKLMSRQIVWSYSSKAAHGMFSHIGSSAQRLANGNTLVCADTEGHIIEVTPAGEAVWEYINPVTSSGILKFKRDNWPMYNSIFRAYRYHASDAPLAGRTLTPGNTITGRTPTYVTP